MSGVLPHGGALSMHGTPVGRLSAFLKEEIKAKTVVQRQKTREKTNSWTVIISNWGPGVNPRRLINTQIIAPVKIGFILYSFFPVKLFFCCVKIVS